MKITKTQLRKIIKEEVMKEYATMGVSSGKHRVQRPQASSGETALQRAGGGKFWAADAEFRQFLKDNPDIANDKEEFNRIGMELQNNPPGGGLPGYSERVKEMLYRLAGKPLPK